VLSGFTEMFKLKYLKLMSEEKRLATLIGYFEEHRVIFTNEDIYLSLLCNKRKQEL